MALDPNTKVDIEVLLLNGTQQSYKGVWVHQLAHAILIEQVIEEVKSSVLLSTSDKMKGTLIFNQTLAQVTIVPHQGEDA